ncbi:hypothetical protein [Amycolatopsis thermoflava]|uniref:hypothetical protein n=1 Tax=Amycolatopsis thermoflava TaxID=84480 RepID=UPI000404CACA|nr:hypothetical protein [Amycolatopsis thermoflava]
MVSQTVLHQAAQRTGFRVQLVSVPVEIIARRHREGQSLAQITHYLRAHLGPENPVASRCFVEWVISATGGEGR